MSEVKFAVKNGDNILGVMWETELLGKVFVTNGKLDINYNLEIRDFDGNDIENIDLKTLLMEILPR